MEEQICGEFLSYSNIFQRLYPGATQVVGVGEVDHVPPMYRKPRVYSNKDFFLEHESKIILVLNS